MIAVPKAPLECGGPGQPQGLALHKIKKDHMAALTEDEIRKTLVSMPGWSYAGNAMGETSFQSFMPAIAFVNKISSCRAGQPPS